MKRTFFCCGLLLGALSLTAWSGLAQAQSDGSLNPSLAPVVFGGHSFDGLSSPPLGENDPIVAGAIGPSSYIQAVNGHIGIFDRFTNEQIATGALSRLAPGGRRGFNPQIIWDPTTRRFYYAMNTGNKLGFGFSKTAKPDSISRGDDADDDWCGYIYDQPDKARLLDYPRLGDSQDFIIIGVNSYEPKTVRQENFVGAGIIAISKPLEGSADPIEVCPTTFNIAKRLDLRDRDSKRVFTPVPANQVDDNATGYVVATNVLKNKNGIDLPSNKFWFFDVTRNSSNGFPVIGLARAGLTVKEFENAPAAEQPDFVQTLDTLDGRLTQAVQAINPLRGTGTNVHSFWVQHTVKHTIDDRSVVRWYEINPRPETPIVLRRGEIGTDSPNDFFFNAAISPDRQSPDGRPANGKHGDSFVIQYNVVSKAREIPPRIVAGSSLKGAGMTFARIKDGIDGYRDATCDNADTDVCRWTRSATASPDPRSASSDRGQVWGSNQYTGDFAANGNNFYTWIFGVRP